MLRCISRGSMPAKATSSSATYACRAPSAISCDGISAMRKRACKIFRASSPSPASCCARARRTLARPRCSIPGPTWWRRMLQLDRNVMVERDQHDQQHETKTEADADQLLLHRQQRLDDLAARLLFQ